MRLFRVTICDECNRTMDHLVEIGTTYACRDCISEAAKLFRDQDGPWSHFPPGPDVRRPYVPNRSICKRCKAGAMYRDSNGESRCSVCNR